MWFKLWQCIVKEFKLLFRDIGGLITLFIMPIILVVVVTSIQDSTYQSISASKIPILWIDHDQDSISLKVKKELEASQSFSLVTTESNEAIAEATAKDLVFKGKYQMAIVIPKNLTSDLNVKVRQNVDGILDEMGMSTSTYDPIEVEKKEIRLYFDPATQAAFKNGIKSNIDKMVAQLESDAIYKTFETQLGGSSSTSFNDTFISFKEIVPQEKNTDVLPNSVQHNVPAWTLFAIFFIIVPLSINIVKEKNQGTYLRLISSPTSNSMLYLGKIITYLVICLLQFYTILIVAKVLFPYMNLPELNLSGSKIILMSLLTLTAGLAAISLGILLG
ncbi:MAG: ABC transporter permease, partial [Myroides sp.]